MWQNFGHNWLVPNYELLKPFNPNQKCMPSFDYNWNQSQPSTFDVTITFGWHRGVARWWNLINCHHLMETKIIFIGGWWLKEILIIELQLKSKSDLHHLIVAKSHCIQKLMDKKFYVGWWLRSFPLFNGNLKSLPQLDDDKRWFKPKVEWQWDMTHDESMRSFLGI